MSLSQQQLWQRFQRYYTEFPELGLSLDLSRMNFPEEFFPSLQPRFEKAFAAMAELEQGAIANPDENRMVGHYWLRNPALAPTAQIRTEIEQAIREITEFSAKVHSGAVRGSAGPFCNLLLIGIGGSALGPQFVANALSHSATDKLSSYFLDNTDPDGMDRIFAKIGSELGRTLCIVVSKSGGTKETRNGMIEAEAVYRDAGLNFGAHAVAITSVASELDRHAAEKNWLARFPMWDWIGGRTSELSAVGLLPAALQGFDVQSLLAGARSCDAITRKRNVKENPAALLTSAWLHAVNGKGTKNMIILPYKDRLELFSKYLQQLIMESLGKNLDLDGNVVNQGITVLGNKGSTDQHAYVQQLIDGRPNFFVTFIEVLRDRAGSSLPVEPNVTSGDYLVGFLHGTRQALYENGRESLAITIPDVSAFTIGILIALFERTVGLYASFINVNAYHQPGVEAGKRAASTVIELQTRIIAYLIQKKTGALTASEISNGIGAPDDVEIVFKICEHLSANPDRGIQKSLRPSPFEARYQMFA